MINKKFKIVLILLTVLIVLTGSIVGLRIFLHKPTEANEIYTVKIETYENIIEISGTVSAAQQQTLQALSAGTVVAVNVKAGDYVKKGDVEGKVNILKYETFNIVKFKYDIVSYLLEAKRF